MGWPGIGWVGLGWVVLSSTGVTAIVGVSWGGLGSAESNLALLGWTGLGLTELG